jgi:hypothetical protein
MTDVLPDRETLTQPIAHRWITTSTIYDPNKTAIIRRDEPLILDSTGEIPRVDVPLSHLLQEPPTGPVPPLPRPPSRESLMKPGREPEYFSPERERGKTGRHRKAAPWWMHAVWGAGAGMVLGALLVGIPVAAMVVR